MKSKFNPLHLIKSSITVSIATLISRIFGFVRDLLMAYFFGTTVVAEAFVIAFRIPNLLRRLFAEGSLVPNFIPVFLGIKTNKSELDAHRYFSAMLNLIIIGLSVIVILSIIFAKYIVIMIAPGFLNDFEKLHLTITLTRIMLPYIILISASSILMGVLNSYKHFLMPALAPVMLNLGFIVAFGVIFLFQENFSISERIFIVSIGVLLGGLMQLLIQIPVLKKLKIAWYPILKVPELGETAKLLLPAMIGAAVFQINVFIDTIISSLPSVQENGLGAPAILYYANRLLQFPMGLFSIAIATALFPYIVSAISKNDIDSAREHYMYSMKTMMTIILPSMIGLIVLGKSIVELLFEHGKFGPLSTNATYGALIFYSLGLVAYSGQKLATNFFYSMKDTKTPLKIGLISIAINLCLNLILIRTMKFRGIALATAISSFYNFIHLEIRLNRKIGFLFPFEFIKDIIKLIIAAAVMGITVYVFHQWFITNYHKVLLDVLLTGIVGTAVYFLLLKVIRVDIKK